MISNAMLMQYTFRIENLSQEVISSFLKKVSHLFIPDLSMDLNIEDYAHKLSEKAICFTAYNGDALSSLIAVYFNDQESQTGYISILATTKEDQKQGIMCKLLDNLFHYGKVNHYKKIILESDNHQIDFYKNRGFSIMQKNLNNCLMYKNL